MLPFVFVSPPLWNNMTLSLVTEVVLVLFQYISESVSGFAVGMVMWRDSYSHCTFQVWPLFFDTWLPFWQFRLESSIGDLETIPILRSWFNCLVPMPCTHHVMELIPVLIYTLSADHFMDDNIFMKPRVTTFLVVTIILCGVNTSLDLDEHRLSSLSRIPKQTSPCLYRSIVNTCDVSSVVTRCADRGSYCCSESDKVCVLSPFVCMHVLWWSMYCICMLHVCMYLCMIVERGD